MTNIPIQKIGILKVAKLCNSWVLLILQSLTEIFIFCKNGYTTNEFFYSTNRYKRDTNDRYAKMSKITWNHEFLYFSIPTHTEVLIFRKNSILQMTIFIRDLNAGVKKFQILNFGDSGLVNVPEKVAYPWCILSASLYYHMFFNSSIR